MPLNTVPLGTFETATDAYVLTDSRGRLRMINEAAGSLLECSPTEVVGRRCWGVVGLRSQDGSLICGADCRVRRRLQKNEPCIRQRVLRYSRSGDHHELDVFSLKVSATKRSWGVLHMIVPVCRDKIDRRPGLPLPKSGYINGLKQLTRRESEVLRALAAGESTQQIAGNLCISLATVRNHIRAVLRKLEVGNRLEAVLIWVSQFR